MEEIVKKLIGNETEMQMFKNIKSCTYLVSILLSIKEFY